MKSAAIVSTSNHHTLPTTVNMNGAMDSITSPIYSPTPSSQQQAPLNVVAGPPKSRLTLQVEAVWIQIGKNVNCYPSYHHMLP